MEVPDFFCNNHEFKEIYIDKARLYIYTLIKDFIKVYMQINLFNYVYNTKKLSINYIKLTIIHKFSGFRKSVELM